MKSIASLFNKGLFKSDLKRFWWISALYTVFLFFILPFRHIMWLEQIEAEWARNEIAGSLDLFSQFAGMQILLLFVAPVAVALLVFRYLQLPHAAGMLHSLPFTRKQHFINHAAAGLLLLFIPLLVNGAFFILFGATTELGEIYSAGDVFRWGGHSLLYIILIYSFAVFVGMFTGNSAAQLAFNYILHLLPLGMFALVMMNLEIIVEGYHQGSEMPQILMKLPIVVSIGSIQAEEVAGWYLFFAAVFLLVAYYAYRIRHLEVAGEVISFSVIQPVFKYGFTVCCTLLGGAYFGAISGGSPVVLLIGYLISSLLGYYLAEMLVQKSYKVWSAYRGYLIYLVVLLVVYFSLQADVVEFGQRVPEPGEIEEGASPARVI